MNEWDLRIHFEEDRPNDTRSPDETDLGRMVHSAAFRRLQGKTQILGLGDSDFYRTRLTHSIEVAQIASGISRHLGRVCSGEEWCNYLPSIPQITTISLAHDIGHPPFGHAGEIALNIMMRNDNGFEGNAQTLRILSKLEPRDKNGGLNLTRRNLLGILKYPVPISTLVKESGYPEIEDDKGNIDKSKIISKEWKPRKGYYDVELEIVDWVFEPFVTEDKKLFAVHEKGKAKYKSLDTTIMDIADDISYGVHDLEDAIHMRFITRADFDNMISMLKDNGLEQWLNDKRIADNFVDHLFSQDKWKIKKAVGSLVNLFIGSSKLVTDGQFSHCFLSYNINLESESRKFLTHLQELVSKKVIKSPQVQTLEYRGQYIIMELFEALASDPMRLLPLDTQKIYSECSEKDKLRVIADHISGMTDEYATKMFERLFVPREGSIFHKM